MKKHIKKALIKNVPKEARRYDVGKTLSTTAPRPVNLNSRRGGAGGGEIPEPEVVRPKRRRVLKIALLMLLAVVGLFVFIGIWDLRNFNVASNKLFGSSAFSVLTPTGLQTDSRGRVNVLVIGYSADDPGHPAAQLTDSLMLLSMDPGTKTGYMLSIPRDLYVKIPGSGYGKINEVYQDGGTQLLTQVVSEDFGVSIPYYTLVNYAAVRGTVDALGGVNVCIISPDPRGLYDPNISPVDGGPLKLANGCQKIDGQTALNLTRARGDPCEYCGEYAYGFPRSDFDRTIHQRQLFSAIKQSVSWKLFLDPRKNSQIFTALGNNIKTDLKADEAIPLYRLFSRIPQDQLKSISLNDINGRNYLRGYQTSYGQSALIPASGLNDYSDIQAVVSQL